MKKVVYRLTENDLHKMIINTVNKILKEDFIPQITDSFDYKTDIMNGHIDDENVSCNDSEVVLNAIGESGSEYQIYATIDCSVTKGARSFDYDVPDDSDEENVNISNIQITKWNDENEEEELPYENDMDFENLVSSHIHVDFDDYEDWGNHVEPEDKYDF